MERLQTIIKSLIEVGDRLSKPVLATGNVHYIEPEDEIYRNHRAKSGQGAMINPDYRSWRSCPTSSRYQKAHLEQPMKCWMNFLRKDPAHKIVIENTNALAEIFEPVEGR